MIPYGRQNISADDINAVVEVLRSDFLTQGPAVHRFEKAVADYCSVAHAVAVNSATSALHIACLALNVGPGDYVWTSTNSFVASANCARYCGAAVDFVDIDAESYNLSFGSLSEKLFEAKQRNKLPKVVIPVHFAGEPCCMQEIHALSLEYGFRIIEDASHAIGAEYRNSRIGDCTYSDITVFSFHPVKIITTAEGGMTTTRSPELCRRMQLLRSHGITRDGNELEVQSEGAWYYEQQSLGFNYRMTDLQAALGISQLSNIDCWIETRHRIASRYDRELSGMPIILPKRSANSRSALHLYAVQVSSRREVFDFMRAAGIGVNVHYIPIHTQPDFRRLWKPLSPMPIAENYYSNCMSLPIYASLTDAEQTHVIRTLQEAIR